MVSHKQRYSQLQEVDCSVFVSYFCIHPIWKVSTTRGLQKLIQNLPFQCLFIERWTIMSYWPKLIFCAWNVIFHISTSQISLTLACNSYADFCDNVTQNYSLNKEDNSDNDAGINITSVSLVNVNNDKNGFAQYIHGGTHNRVIRSSFKPYRSEKELSLQITTVLDKLLFESGYDRQIRPQLEGPPLEVQKFMNNLHRYHKILSYKNFLTPYCFIGWNQHSNSKHGSSGWRESNLYNGLLL